MRSLFSRNRMMFGMMCMGSMCMLMCALKYASSPSLSDES